MGFTDLFTQNRNVIINPTFDIWQRTTSLVHGVGANSNFAADRWYLKKEANHQFTQSRSIDVPPNSPSWYSTYIQVNTPYASLTGEFASYLQKIEGFNARSLMNQRAILVLDVKSNKVGKYGVRLRSSSAHKSIFLNFNINSVATWETKLIEVPTVPFNSGWNIQDGIGMYLEFILGNHANQQLATENEWVDNDFSNTTGPGVIDFGGETGGEIHFANVGLYSGIDVIPFHQLRRDIGSELSLCQRYYEKSKFSELVYVPTGGTAYAGHNVSYKTEKRAVPSMTIIDLNSTGNAITLINTSNGGQIHNQGYLLHANLATGHRVLYTAGSTIYGMGWNWRADSEL